MKLFPLAPVAVDVLVGQEEVQELGHVPHLLGHGVAVYHEHDGTGGATELINNLSIKGLII